MTPDPLAVLLRKQGWEPDSNVCRCGHLGGEHDLNNWCLTCQPPRSDYFASFSQGELWDNAVASLRAAGATLDTERARHAALVKAAQAVVDAWVDDESGMGPFDPDLMDRLADALTATPAPALDGSTVMAVAAEIGRARGLFPKPDGLLAALVEEVGEVARALLSESDERVREECIQVAAMAVRIAEEGDPTLAAFRPARAYEEADR